MSRPQSPSPGALGLTLSTPNPVSSLKNVTRSISPEISSVAGLRSGIAAFMSLGVHFRRRRALSGETCREPALSTP